MDMLVGNRFLILRRGSQLLVMLLFAAGVTLGWSVLRGNLSTSRVFGFVTLADPFAVIQAALSGVIVPMGTLEGAVLIAAFFVIVGGRAFCSWVCPMNTVTDAANWIRKRVGKAEHRVQMPRSIRYWAISIALILSALLGISAFEWVSPISMLHRGIIYGMGLGWVAVLAIFIFDLALVKNGFCGHLCPLGGFYALIGRFSLLRVRHFKQECTRCMRCVEYCPEDHVLSIVGRESGMVLSGECTNCGRCIDVCPDGAMEFGNRLRRRTAKEGVL